MSSDLAIHRKHNIYIVNKRTFCGDNGIYIGRPSILGNPFKSSTRKENVEDFRKYLWECVKKKNQVYAELIRLSEKAKTQDLILVCWCKRSKQDVLCHGDVIKSAIDWMNNGNNK